MAAYSNYIKDTNRFQLAGPPSWFLRQLWEYDPSLVIVPSRMGFFYRLAQRRQLKLPESIINDVLKEQADTRMLAAYSLVPVTTILATVRWDSPLIFQDLTMKAPWRMCGAEKYEQELLRREKQEFFEKREKQDEHLGYLAKDAWRFYQKKIGVRTRMWSPTTKHREEQKSHAVIIPAGKYTPILTTGFGETVARRG